MDSIKQRIWNKLKKSQDSLSPITIQEDQFIRDKVVVRAHESRHSIIYGDGTRKVFNQSMNIWTNHGGLCNSIADKLFNTLSRDFEVLLHANKIVIFWAENYNHAWLIIQFNGKTWILDASGSSGVLFEPLQFIVQFGHLKRYIDTIEEARSIQEDKEWWEAYARDQRTL